MKNYLTQNQLANAVKRATLCAATANLLTAAPMVQALDIEVGGYVKTDATVLITAETGTCTCTCTCNELVARRIHERSQR